MSEATDLTVHVPYISTSSLTAGLFISAALGGGPPHSFQLDTGSVGIIVPRRRLGRDYQDFDPSLDISFGYISSGNSYMGQWVQVPVVLGVPAGWDGTGDFPVATIEVFAVDQPCEFDGGVLGIGFGIGNAADGGPYRNPLLHLTYQGQPLSQGYIVTTQGLEAGLTPLNTQGFAFITLVPSDGDWQQPLGRYSLAGAIAPNIPAGDLRILMDTGIAEMILWLSDPDARPDVPAGFQFPAGVSVSIAAPPADPVLAYDFVTGTETQPMAPSYVEWRVGTGINTGRNVLAGADYLYDAAAGRIGFRTLAPPA